MQFYEKEMGVLKDRIKELEIANRDLENTNKELTQRLSHHRPDLNLSFDSPHYIMSGGLGSNITPGSFLEEGNSTSAFLASESAFLARRGAPAGASPSKKRHSTLPEETGAPNFGTFSKRNTAEGMSRGGAFMIEEEKTEDEVEGREEGSMKSSDREKTFIEDITMKVERQFEDRLSAVGNALIDVLSSVEDHHDSYFFKYITLLRAREHSEGRGVYNIQFITELIREIQEKVVDLKRTVTHMQASQLVGSNSYAGGGSRARTGGIPAHPASSEDRSVDTKLILLEEKEKRLEVQERLSQTVDELTKARIELERAKKDQLYERASAQQTQLLANSADMNERMRAEYTQTVRRLESL